MPVQIWRDQKTVAPRVPARSIGDNKWQAIGLVRGHRPAHRIELVFPYQLVREREGVAFKTKNCGWDVQPLLSLLRRRTAATQVSSADNTLRSR